MPPRDVTILFDNIAAFNCTGHGELFEWTYDGVPVTSKQGEIAYHNVSDGMVSSSLYINATIDKDGAAIVCRIITTMPYEFDEERAYLYVLCISPVRDLSLSIDDVPYVTWTIPSVIATDIPVSDIQYTVTLEGGNITSTVNDIDDTYYQFTDITVLNCTEYTANVTAYDVKNQVYSSDAASAGDVAIDSSKNNHYH